MIVVAAPTEVTAAVARLDGWLDTMRGPGGYGGPVAHWWQQSLLYTGAGLDWRYEGIIAGYLQLWERTGDEEWLAKAQRAGDDLVDGQLASGNFQASAFEINPATAGTPHEAACDVGLLLLALALRAARRAGWQRYARCAERNLRRFYVGQLWDTATRSFRDSPMAPSFVPNKAATACDALFLLSDVTGDAVWAEQYALPTLDRIIAHQVTGGVLDGAIAQNSLGTQVIAKYFPIYIARCVSALLHGFRWSGSARYAESALRALGFVARWADADGSLPTVVYANRRTNRFPSWIAPLGDVLRAADELAPYGFGADLSAMRARLLAGQDTSGGLSTATGFAAQAGGKPGPVPDLRDVLHVAGWCDKAFRYLAGQVDGDLAPVARDTFEATCVFRGQLLQLVETPAQLELRSQRGVVYSWRKGEARPRVATPEFWLR